jgi:hypothetical protein
VPFSDREVARAALAERRAAMNGGDPVMRPAVLMCLDDVARAVGGIVYGSRVGIAGVRTDSRAVSTGGPLRGDRRRALRRPRFVEDAMRRGAVAALTARRVRGRLPIPQVVDGDTRIALGSSPPTGARASRCRSWRSPAATARPR